MPDDRVPPSGPRHVDPAYRHRPKLVTPQARLDLSGTRLKWYDLAYADVPIPDAIRQTARDYLTAESKAGRLELDGDVGFVVLHSTSTRGLCGSRPHARSNLNSPSRSSGAP